MEESISSHTHQPNNRKLLEKDKRLKKIISTLIYLNNKFEKQYSINIHKIYFTGEKLKELNVAHQKDILNILNSFLEKEGFKKTTIRTLREDLKFLLKIQIINKRIITFSNNIGQYKGKLCIYKVSSIAFKLIDTYFNNFKFEAHKKIKSTKLEIKNVNQNVSVYIKDNKYINKNSKDSNKNQINKKIILEDKLKLNNKLEDKDFQKIKDIIKDTKKPNESYKNSIFNLKDFLRYLESDYKAEDIVNFYMSKLKKYKNKIHFLRHKANYDTDFYKLMGEFKDTYESKWKEYESKAYSSYNFKEHRAGDVANNILNNILRNKI